MKRDHNLFAVLVASMLLVGTMSFLCGCTNSPSPTGFVTVPVQTTATIANFSDELTWEEYEALDPSEKELFFDSFPSVEAFDAWLREATRVRTPWENGGKQPDEYTWEEYDALSPSLKEQFFDCFSNMDDFDAWMIAAQQNVDLPWDNGGLQPWEYSWEEYEALTSRQKEAFFDWFGSAESFDIWLNGAMEEEVGLYPWEQENRNPNSYSWAEYVALGPSEKEAFFDAFPSAEEFDSWLQEAQANVEYIWEKNLEDYTWAEYEAMPPSQKELFFDSFESLEAFQAWMARVNLG